MDGTIIFYMIFLGLLLFALTILIRKYGEKLYLYSVLAALYSMCFLWVSFNFGRDVFDAMNMVCMGLFGGGIYLLIISSMKTWSRYKFVGWFFAIVALVATLIMVDAFLVEPYWLDVSRYSVRSAKIPKAVKVVVVSDLQTDSVGSFEEYVLRTVMEEKPDMIVLPGDYIQAPPPHQKQQMEKLNQLFHRIGLSAPLGVYATQGDSEPVDWEPIFKDLPVEVFSKSGTVSNQDFAITGLTLQDSYKLAYSAPDTDLFHIWIGHRPDFSLFKQNGDLLISGHTHGGQVQIPFFGPLIIFSEVPRTWGAGGLFELKNSSRLVVSRGIGMERGFAPRIRFFCRPQVVVVNLSPEKKDQPVSD